jgi:hypothetical protein
VRATPDLLDRVEVEADASSSPARLLLVLRVVRAGNSVASEGVVRAKPRPFRPCRSSRPTRRRLLLG